MAQEQRDFHIEAVVGNRFTPTLKRALDPIFHRVDMQVQFVGGGLEAGPAVQKLPERFAHPFVTVRRGGKGGPGHRQPMFASALGRHKNWAASYEAGIAVHRYRRRMRFRGEYNGARRQRLLM